MIRDEQACLNYLRRKYASVEKDLAVELYKDIVNGIVRVNLAAVKPKDLEQLGRAFISSAVMHKGMMDSFLNKLEVLQKLAEEGVFAFDTNALTSHLSEYKAVGYPAVSHDEIYRITYKPAYRIVLSKLCE